MARCGSQIYHHSELPLEPNADGLVFVHRDPAEVFKPDSVASFNAKPIVNDHPYEEVNPTNWSNLAVGIMTNPRRGTGADDDVLLADLLFTTPAGIRAVQSGKRAVSVGYDAHYEQTAPGLGRQKNIVCNHLALVDVARCGPRCTIMDGGLPLYSDAWRATGPLQAAAHQERCGCAACAAPALDGLTEPPRPGDHDDIDWRDDWNEQEHPRVPAGSEGGGEFTKGGGGAASSVKIQTTTGAVTAIHQPSDRLRDFATQVPDAEKAWVARRGSAKALKAYAVRALHEGHDPRLAVETLKEIAGREVHGAVADYANKLIDLLARAHEMDLSMHGRATARQGRRQDIAPTPQPQPQPEPAPDFEARMKQRRRDYAGMVPDARETWVAKRASARQMKALVIKALEEDEPPLETVKKLKELAAKELHGAVARYANTLIDHMAEAWATDFSLHRATPRKADVPQPRPAPEPSPQPEPHPVPPKPPTPEPKPTPGLRSKASLPSNISEVLAQKGARMTPLERDYHAKSWTNATMETLGAIQNLKILSGGVSYGSGAHYKPSLHGIQMQNEDKDSRSRTGTWRHEMGHAIDWNGDGYGTGAKFERNNQSYRAEQDRADEASKLVQAVRQANREKRQSTNVDPFEWEGEIPKSGLTEAQIKAFAGASLSTKVALMELLNYGNVAHTEAIRQGVPFLPSGQVERAGWVESSSNNSHFQDFVGSMTHEQVGNGHGKAYYDRMPAYKTAEMFANYVDLTNTKHGTIWRKILHAIAPKCCAHFDDIIAERAGLKDGPANPNAPDPETLRVQRLEAMRAASRQRKRA